MHNSSISFECAYNKMSTLAEYFLILLPTLEKKQKNPKELYNICPFFSL
jgi:hypothetical protein